MPVYLDCNATSPMEDAVLEEVMNYMRVEYGNSGSRTHSYGLDAKRAVESARAKVASVVDAEVNEVFFTSGATESNNLAILGLREHAESVGRKHIVSTALEHKAVLEPLEVLERRGYEVSLVRPNSGGWVEPEAIRAVVRDDTVLVSLMHVNNETGIVQCLPELTELLQNHPTYLHVDGAQGFGKDLDGLRDPRIDLISVSGHKIYGPKGIGALIARRRGYEKPPLTPLVFGGGQERGLRPGTLPVALIAGLGVAAELAALHAAEREKQCTEFRRTMLAAIEPLEPVFHGDQARVLPHVVNLSFPGLDSEALMVALKDHVAVSNGSACTSSSYEPSHVLKSMGLSDDEIQGALRFSWCHMTADVAWDGVVGAIKRLM
ncbi:MAG: cysteine desulfurase DndA [Candidatus Latescibacteria bacterium]|nr:cysteine desulfurase DndA [Candidatus Latescibacterota bacterium]